MGPPIVVHHETTRALVPSVRALHDPALGLNDKAFGIGFHCEQIPLPGAYPTPNVAVGRGPHNLHADTELSVASLNH